MSENKEDRKKAIEQAKLAEATERYEDMAMYMNEYVSDSGVLEREERNLLSVAYKNVVGAKRSAWRIISSIEHKEEGANRSEKVTIAGKYRKKIEEELDDVCRQVINLLENKLIPPIKEADDNDGKVFYFKMMGDYYRYLAEVDKTSDDKNKAEKAYIDATEVCKELANTSPTALGLALNFSVFYYEIMNDSDKACSIAKKAFDSAIAELDQLKEESYKDSTLIMQLLRDNLTLWTAADGQNDDEPENN